MTLVPNSYRAQLTDLANEVAEIADALDSTNVLRGQQLGKIAHRIAALRDVPSGPTQPVPAGWKLVPLEPTDEMVEIGRNAMLTQPLRDWNPQNVRAYKAMVEAAPSATEERAAPQQEE